MSFVVSRIVDTNGTNGACCACSDHYHHLIPELERVRMHNQIMKEKRISQVKHAVGRYLRGQNHKARRKWLWRHFIDGNAKWIGHKVCIGRLTRSSDKLLSKLKRDKLLTVKGRAVPARRVLASDKLLEELKARAGAGH